MTQKELTILNLGQSLDDLANLDPRGYGVCKLLYEASRSYTGGPTSMNAASRLIETVKEGYFVYILTGFVLRPYKKAEMDGIVSSMLLCRALVKGLGAHPVVVCPEDNRPAVERLSAVVGLSLTENLATLPDSPKSMGVFYFTKDEKEAPFEADKLLSIARPSAVISIECPGANSRSVYHNAIGLDVTELEAKQDVLFEKAQEKGILNIAIGDLGNEIGMGTLSDTLISKIPYAKEGTCRCGCGGGIMAHTRADHLITATVSDWGCYAMIAAMAFLKEDLEIMHTADLEKRVIETASESGMIDMTGQLIPAVDGIGLEINLPIVQLMRELVNNALKCRDLHKTWFERVDELGGFA